MKLKTPSHWYWPRRWTENKCSIRPLIRWYIQSPARSLTPHIYSPSRLETLLPPVHQMVVGSVGCRNGICGLVICWRYLCLRLVRSATLSDLLRPTKTYCVNFAATALSFTFTFVLRCKITSFSIVVFKVCYYSCFPFVFISIIACEICLMIPKKFKPPN